MLDPALAKICVDWFILLTPNISICPLVSLPPLICAKHRSTVDNEGEFITLSKIEDTDYEDQESADKSESSSESTDSDSESEETVSFEPDETISESDESSSD